jgi:hypothetical protein
MVPAIVILIVIGIQLTAIQHAAQLVTPSIITMGERKVVMNCETAVEMNVIHPVVTE